MFTRMMAMLAVLTLVSAASAPAQAFETKEERICAAAKLKAAGKKEHAKLQCEAKALSKDLAVTDAECLEKAEGKFAAAFSKIETKGDCVSGFDAVTVELAVDNFVDNEIVRQRMLAAPLLPCDVLNEACGTCGDGMCVVTDEGQMCVSGTGGFVPCPPAGCPQGYACYHLLFTPPLLPPIEITSCLPSCSTADPPDLDKDGRLCAASKLKATGKNAFSKIKCEAKAILKEIDPTDPECLAKADDKLDTAFEKAEGKGGCVSTGDVSDVRTKADGFVATEVLRQQGALLPSCPTPDVACGSCGFGQCTFASEGLFCVDQSVAPVSPCPAAGCPAGTHCLSALGFSACVAGCP